MGVCNCSMFCCTLLYVHFSFAIILMGKRELIALLNLSSWCLVMVERLFLTVPRGCLQFVIVVFPDHTHLLFLIKFVRYFRHLGSLCFPKGTNCAPLVADLFLFCYETDFILPLSDNNQTDIIEAFKSTSRYLDDLLTDIIEAFNSTSRYLDDLVNMIILILNK